MIGKKLEFGKDWEKENELGVIHTEREFPFWEITIKDKIIQTNHAVIIRDRETNKIIEIYF